MNAQTPDISLTRQLQLLEERLECLLALLDQYAGENHALKQREHFLVLECNTLRQRNQQAGQQLESILQRIKQASSLQDSA